MPSEPEAPAAPQPYTHVNRRGVSYYLHRVKTKLGKDRYVMTKERGADPVPAIPPGYEVSESINGVVSVVHTRSRRVPEGALEAVQAELAKHSHLRRHQVSVIKDAVVVFIPATDMSPESLARLAQERKLPIEKVRKQEAKRIATGRFEPVLRFLFDPVGGSAAAQRLVYRGSVPRWLMLGFGTIELLAERYLPHVGRPSFYDLV
jgi:hypothetical protein